MIYNQLVGSKLGLSQIFMFALMLLASVLSFFSKLAYLIPIYS
ncbi:hypothetical protein BTN49_0316 (plasmid) [Candidatus Enterovibrio escicola]|uniref:Uncharacterized protein n=1 Tax=Candidatus Enterovibrio escicola TaxID=1927127 RepID=A0A2A5T770_9GAMM|nr:hypothetical protein BTN49_0316 [Candidatus Enterovibrio escacola]